MNICAHMIWIFKQGKITSKTFLIIQTSNIFLALQIVDASTTTIILLPYFVSIASGLIGLLRTAYSFWEIIFLLANVNLNQILFMLTKTLFATNNPWHWFHKNLSVPNTFYSYRILIFYTVNKIIISKKNFH